MKRESIQFQETQQFRQWWVWLLVGLVAAIFWAEMVAGAVWMIAPERAPAGLAREELPSTLIVWGIFWILFGVALPLLFYLLKLIVKVTDSGISIRYFPLLSRVIPLKDIKRIEVRQFRPFRDYGGRGIRFSSDKGLAYFVNGNQGVWIELKDGEKLLIGSQRAEELLDLIQRRQGKRKKTSA